MAKPPRIRRERTEATSPVVVSGPAGATGPTLSFIAPEHSISAPSTLQWHLISEEELTLLVHGGRDTSLEWGLALGGAGVGLLPTLIKVGFDFAKNATVSGLDLVLSAIAIAVIAGAGMCLWYYHINEKIETEIEQRIRSRSSRSLHDVSGQNR